MFDSLDEQIKHDTEEQTTSRERMTRWLAVMVLSLLIFGGLYLGLRFLE